MYLKFCTDNCS